MKSEGKISMDKSFEKKSELNKLLTNESKKLLDLKIVEAI